MPFTPKDRIRGPFSFSRGRETYKITVSEKWVPTNYGRVLRCTDTDTITLKKSHGISAELLREFRSVLETSLGIPEFFSVKASIEQATSLTLNWSEEEGMEQSFTLEAPGCGSRTYMIYRMDRVVDVMITKKRRVLSTLTHKLPPLVERTNLYDLRITSEDDEPRCPCPPGRMVAVNTRAATALFSFGNLSIHTDIVARGGERVFSLGGPEIVSSAWDIRATDPNIPDFLFFLAGLDRSDEDGFLLMRIEPADADPETETGRAADAAERASLVYE